MYTPGNDCLCTNISCTDIIYSWKPFDPIRVPLHRPLRRHPSDLFGVLRDVFDRWRKTLKGIVMLWRINSGIEVFRDFQLWLINHNTFEFNLLCLNPRLSLDCVILLLLTPDHITFSPTTPDIVWLLTYREVLFLRLWISVNSGNCYCLQK